jgi:hypothetical protein
MKRIVPLVLCTLIATSPLAFAEGHGKHGKGHGKQGHGAVMRHANPMPNLMKVVKKHGDQLNLSDEQRAALTQWHSQNADSMHGRFDRIKEMEAELNAASLAGKPKAELMVMASRIMNERTEIISIKTDCRDNMRRVLTPDQYAKVLEIYAQK